MSDQETTTDAPARQWPVTITLKHPVDFGETHIASLEFRRGKMGDMKGIKLSGEDMQIDHLVLVASRLCGQPIKVIEMLDAADAGEVMSIALDFFARCLVAGGSKR